MPTEVVFPKVDMDSDSGRIARWFARDGDAVKQGQLLFEIESDKAAVEVDAPADGVLGDTLTTTDLVKVGQAVAWIFAPGETRNQSIDAAGDTSKTGRAPQPEQLASPVPDRPAAANNGHVLATPLARRLAREARLDLSGLSGTGPRGRIQKKDVLAHVANDARPAPVAHAAQATTHTQPTPLNCQWLRKGDGIPIVFLHGFGADLNGWRPMLAGISFEKPILSIDLPGHGKSPLSVPETLEQIAELVERTVEIAGLGPFILVGHSFGGAVAASIASRRMADVRALVLAAPAGLGPEINGAFLQGFARARSRASVLPWVRQLTFDEATLSDGFVDAIAKQSQDAELRDVQSALAGQFFADGTQTFDIRAWLAALAMPVRVVFGANDRIIPAMQARGLPGEIALHVFDRCGHLPQIERREQFLRILEEVHRTVGL